MTARGILRSELDLPALRARAALEAATLQYCLDALEGHGARVLAALDTPKTADDLWRELPDLTPAERLRTITRLRDCGLLQQALARDGGIPRFTRTQRS